MCEKKYKVQDLSSGEILCYSCNQKKTLDNFYKHKGGRYNYKCKECISSSRERKYEKREVIEGKIKCDECSLLKELSDFDIVDNKYPSRKCKHCLKETKYNKNEEYILLTKGYRICNICNETLPLDKFNSKFTGKFRKCSCKKCLYKKNLDRVKNYRNKNKEKYNQIHKKWRQTDKGKEYFRTYKKNSNNKIKEEKKLLKSKEKEERSRRWKEQLEFYRLEREKKEKIKQDEINKKKEYYNSVEYLELKREKQYERWKKRWDNDDLFAMRVRVRNLVRNTFRRYGYKKPQQNTLEILGCDFEKLKHHFESQFKEGMDWSNRGEWHIDHIIPLSTAQTKDDLIKLSHYTNLQPLWADENMKKSNKII